MAGLQRLLLCALGRAGGPRIPDCGLPTLRVVQLGLPWGLQGRDHTLAPCLPHSRPRLPCKELVWVLRGHVELNNQEDGVTRKREPGGAEDVLLACTSHTFPSTRQGWRMSGTLLSTCPKRSQSRQSVGVLGPPSSPPLFPGHCLLLLCEVAIVHLLIQGL